MGSGRVALPCCHIDFTQRNAGEPALREQAFGGKDKLPTGVAPGHGPVL